MPALIALMDRADLNGQVFNIGSNRQVTIEALARKILERTGSSSEIVYVPYEEAYGEGYEDMRHRAPCLERIQAAIGYAPKTSLEAILDAVIADQRARLAAQ